jgi:hypothetical protein
MRTANATQLIEEAINISQTFHVYLAIAFDDVQVEKGKDLNDPNNAYHNRLVMIQPSSETQPLASVAFEINKIYPIRRLEGPQVIAGQVPDYLPTVDTPYGRIGALMYTCLVLYSRLTN